MMFVQVIQGQVSDAEEIHAAFDRWATELAPGATGWLGSTAGVTDDGYLIALARFESAEAARANSGRAEQDQWWIETSKLFSGEVAFHDSTDIDLDIQGDPDQAKFVQVMQGRTSNPARARELMNEGDPKEWAAWRPDIIASVGAAHDGDAYTMALYFTSEAEAREGEKKDPPEAMQAIMAEMDSLTVGETTFYDLKSPWFYSAG